MAAVSHGSYPPLAFVDLETTGMTPARHRIMEIGIVTVDAERVTEWSSLVNPGGYVPAFTRAYTGISDAMVADAPRFEQIAPDVERLLRGRLFIAHNARFDHGFLRAEFTRLAIDFRPRLLCTVRLSRRLYPQFARHDLDSVMARHGLSADARHRALADARLIWQFWQAAHQDLPQAAITAAIDALLAAPPLPAQLDPALVEDLPESPGAYVLYGARKAPLYVGKATSVKHGVLSQLRAESQMKQALARQVIDIEWHATGGTLGACLKAAVLARTLLPVLNRRRQPAGALCSWRLTPHAVTITELAWIGSSAGCAEDLFGLFSSERKARNALRRLARSHSLCYSLLGLQPAATDKPHLACRVADCTDECARADLRRLHMARFIAAAAAMKIKSWPYAGAIGIREGRELHVADQWRYLGTAHSEDAAVSLLENELPPFDLEIFGILTRWLPRHPRRWICELGPGANELSAQTHASLSRRSPAASLDEWQADAIPP